MVKFLYTTQNRRTKFFLSVKIGPSFLLFLEKSGWPILPQVARFTPPYPTMWSGFNRNRHEASVKLDLQLAPEEARRDGFTIFILKGKDKPKKMREEEQ